VQVVLRRFGLGLYGQLKLEEEHFLGDLPKSETYRLSVVHFLGDVLTVYVSGGVLKMVAVGHELEIDPEQGEVLLERGTFVIPDYSLARVRDLRKPPLLSRLFRLVSRRINSWKRSED
jgi:hypothetical protein